VQEIKQHGCKVWAIEFSPDGDYLASAGQDGRILIFRTVAAAAAAAVAAAAAAALEGSGAVSPVAANSPRLVHLVF
jgi:NAD(P)H-hydrate repair Nnr-like enzyme with NAD(P)H-hydrate dehydratase domain